MDLELLREIHRCLRGLDVAIQRAIERETRRQVEDDTAVDESDKIVIMKRAEYRRT